MSVNGKEEQSPNLQAPALPVVPSARCQRFQGLRACLLKSFLSIVQKKKKKAIKDGEKGRGHLQRDDRPAEELSFDTKYSPTHQEAPRPYTQTHSPQIFHPRGWGARVGTHAAAPRSQTPGSSAPREARPGRFGKARAMILCYS